MRVAANYARSGSALEQQAVACWLKHVDVIAVYDPALAVEAADVATIFAPSGSALKQAAAAKLTELRPARKYRHRQMCWVLRVGGPRTTWAEFLPPFRIQNFCTEIKCLK